MFKVLKAVFRTDRAFTVVLLELTEILQLFFLNYFKALTIGEFGIRWMD